VNSKKATDRYYFNIFVHLDKLHQVMTIEINEEHKIKLLNSDDVFSVMQKILLREQKIDQEKEHFWMIGLEQNNRILYIELVSLGSVKATTVEPMNVYRVAVMKGAVKVLMVHNHPSGELKPSETDKDLTDRLIQVGRILNIKVIDHIVISLISYLSFSDTGLLSELEQSTKWVPQYELIDRIRQEEKKIRNQALKEARDKAKAEKLKAVKRKQLEIAKQLKDKGIAAAIIAETTGLSETEIKNI
jgi:DNA repair protein RadC